MRAHQLPRWICYVRVDNPPLLFRAVVAIRYDLRASQAGGSSFLSIPSAGRPDLAWRQSAHHRIKPATIRFTRLQSPAEKCLQPSPMQGAAIRKTWPGSAGAAKARTSSVTGRGSER